MNRAFKSAAMLAIATAISAPVVAQIVARRIDQNVLTMPANTQVFVSLNSEVTTKHTAVGDTFDVTVTRPVIVGDYIVIPQGTLGHGKIVWRTGKGVYGKSAKMKIELTDLMIGDTMVPLTGQYSFDGKGNTGWTVGVALGAAPVWALLVTGHSASIPQGTEFRAFTAAPAPFSLSNSGSQVAAYGVAPTTVSGRGMNLSAYDAGRRTANIQMSAMGAAPGINVQ